MKSGKFFSALDARFPTRKLRAILENLQPTMIVSDRAKLSLAQELASGRCECNGYSIP